MPLASIIRHPASHSDTVTFWYRTGGTLVKGAMSLETLNSF